MVERKMGRLSEWMRPCGHAQATPAPRIRSGGAGGRLASVTVDPAKESARNFGNRDSGLKFAKLKRAA